MSFTDNVHVLFPTRILLWSTQAAVVELNEALLCPDAVKSLSEAVPNEQEDKDLGRYLQVRACWISRLFSCLFGLMWLGDGGAEDGLPPEAELLLTSSACPTLRLQQTACGT